MILRDVIQSTITESMYGTINYAPIRIWKVTAFVRFSINRILNRNHCRDHAELLL